MFGIFRVFVKKWRAKRAAGQIWPLLLPAFVLFYGPTGELDRKMQTDEPLLSYMYGVFTFWMEKMGMMDTTDDLLKGFTMWQCFERFFPGEGKQVLNLCNQRLEAKDENFKRGLAKAYKETMEICKSEGQGDCPYWLTKHLVRHYSST